nr:hypothetical protein [Tanacetum cinerariifolium]
MTGLLFRMFRVDRTEVRGKMKREQVQLVMGSSKQSWECGQDNVVDEDVDEPSVQDLALNGDNVFQADEYPVYDEAGLSYDSYILSEVHDHDNYQDAICEYHEAHKMHDNVQPNCVVDSNAEYTGDNNMIPYDHYVKENTKPVVQNNVSYVPNDAYMMIINKEQTVQCIYAKAQIKVVDASLTAELATCKEQVELYERRAKFELTEGEQKIEEQLRIVITDRNIKEENFKEELHSVKMQLNSIINHNKSMVEKVTSLKKDFKQKENKYLEEFLDIKALKEKADDKLIKQDRSLQTVHMLCKPKPYYDEQINIAIGYKNPLCLTHAKQVQPALYTTDPRTDILVQGCSDKSQSSQRADQSLKTKQSFESALTKEIKMKENFKELEAEVDQNAMNRKCDEIEWKNLLIANDNLIVDCLSKEVFYIATNYELNVSRFTEMHDAHTVVQARFLELKAELSKLNDKIQKDNHNELVKHFSNLEVYWEDTLSKLCLVLRLWSAL